MNSGKLRTVEQSLGIAGRYRAGCTCSGQILPKDRNEDLAPSGRGRRNLEQMRLDASARTASREYTREGRDAFRGSMRHTVSSRRARIAKLPLSAENFARAQRHPRDMLNIPMSAPDSFIITKALEWLAEGRRVALATVIQTWGSAPQPVGSRLLIDADGNFLGSVSGGCVEAEVITEAAEVIARGEPRAFEYSVEDNTAWKVGLACGGSLRIFVEKVERDGDSSAHALHQLINDIKARRQVALVTDLPTGGQRLARSPEDVDKAVAPALEEAFRCDKSIAIAAYAGEVFINVFNPTVRLIIIGAVHIAQQLVPIARALGQDVVIVDPRIAFATEERFGDAEISNEWPDEALPKIGVDARTALIALTHDPKIDDPALIHALSSNAFYVGALGSRKTHAKRVERLLKAGVASADIERIHAPIGLDIGAQGAAEIALSIMAEITAVQRGKADRAR